MLEAALAGMPGAVEVKECTHQQAAYEVEAEFVVRVRHGIADAARDGSRLAKEGLKIAKLPDAALVELRVTRESPSE